MVIQEKKAKEEKRIPPWERARIIVHMQEEERRRRMVKSETSYRKQKASRLAKNPSPLDSLEENRKRIVEIRKRMMEDREIT